MRPRDLTDAAPAIVASGTASPPFRLDQSATRTWLEHLYGNRRELPVLLRMAEGGGVRTRQLALPPGRVVVPRPFAERNAEYVEGALPLAERAARLALDGAALDGAEVDYLVTTSCTGLMIPALASHLVPRLGLRDDVVRLPVTELGCAAGAAALARAADFCRAHPTATVLVIAVELCSLTFRATDVAMANLVSATLFGDGAAAAVVRGGGHAAHDLPRGRRAVEIVASASHLFPGSARLMGFEVDDGGLRIVLSRDVPAFLRGRVRPLVESLCEAQGVPLSSLRFAAIHPGGRRILEDLEGELGVGTALTWASREVLAEHGNMSSATVLFVLDRLLGAGTPPDGSHGLLMAFGPGFAAELSLLRWRGAA